MNGNLLRQLARFSSRYETYLASEKQSFGLPSWEALRTDWWIGLRFFLNRAFMQGRRDSVSLAFLEATNTALAELLPPGLGPHERANRVLEWSAAGWFGPANWSNPNNPVRHALDQRYVIQVNGQAKTSGTGKARDREMVLDGLRFICEHALDGQILNIAAYTAERIEAGETSVVYRELDGIRQVGPKIAAFFLRDLVAVLELQSRLSPADYRLLQPVDTWVEKIAGKMNIQAGPHGLAAAIAETCQREGVDPIRFNQGAWYLGAHSFDLLLENLERIEP
ncbi:MAG TPA: hypothetical protein VNA25_16140 [Phycisphaerae bacterium]|nr:hypothetical protein [Phycisphaerae bacterium]